MANNIRSEYIKNLVEDRDKLTQKLEETTKNTLQNVVEETINKQLRQMISEANDDFEVEEVKPDTDDTATSDVENPADGEGAAIDANPEGGEDAGAVADDNAGAEGGDAAADAATDDAAGDEVWDGLEQYKGEDGEYDLTSMGKDDVIKVLKVMGPEDGVRVLKNDNGTVTLQDDETDKEYIIDLDGSTGSSSDADAEGDDDIEIELDDDDTTDECNAKPGKVIKEGEVNLGYTDSYQGETAMTVDSNKETANSKDTYSMDAGVPTGTEKPWVGHKGNMSPYGSKEKKVNEGEACEKCGKNPCECGKKLDETMTSTENSANVRGDGMTHANTNSHQKFARNGHVGGQQTRGTGEGYEPANESIDAIKRKANAIFLENKELRNIAESIKNKLEEAIVVNSSLGNIIKLVTENSTTLEEKKNIIKRFDSVKTINEGKALYNTISEELKKSTKVNNTSETKLDNQLAESKKTQLVETTMYQSADLSATLSLMERLSKL